MNTSLASIDIGRATENLAVEKLRRVCEEIGMFTITGHEVSESLLAQTDRLARQFFALPMSEKQRARAEHGAGYVPLLDDGLAPDNCTPKEAFNVIKGQMDCRWPERPEHLERTFSAYFEAMEALATALMRLFAQALNLSLDHFSDRFGVPLSILRIVHYPAVEEAAATAYRCEPHTDLGTLTIIRSENAPGGLQVANREGAWLDVRTPPGALLVNLGDEMARWTAGRWHSPVHRVVSPPQADRWRNERLSLIFFHNPVSIREQVEAYLAGALSK